MAKSYEAMEDSNPSDQPHIRELRDPGRRIVLKASAGAAASALFAPWLAACATAPADGRMKPGFEPIPIGSGDRLVVPQGLRRRRLRAVGRARRPARQHAGVAPRWRQHRGRTGRADGHAPRRHALLPDRRFAPGAAGDEPRVRRRRPAASRRAEDLDAPRRCASRRRRTASPSSRWSSPPAASGAWCGPRAWPAASRPTRLSASAARRPATR